MEQWLVTHWFNVGSTAVFLLSVVVHYTKTSAHIAALEIAVGEVRLELKRVKEEGLPFMCKFHEERIGNLEKLIQTQLGGIQSDIAALKRMAEDNRLMIQREQHK